MIRLLRVATAAGVFLSIDAFAQIASSITTTSPSGREVVTIYSADRNVRVVIEETDDESIAAMTGDDDDDDASKLNVTVVSGEGATERTLWRAKIRGDLFEFGADEELFLSANGNYFVLPPNFWHSDRLRIFTATGTKKVNLREGDGAETGAGDWIVGWEKVEGQDLLRIWHAGRDRWLVFTLPDAKPFRPSAELREKWNTETRSRVLELFARKATGALRERIEEKAGRFGKLAGLITRNEPAETLNDAHYAFLVARKDPSDRKLFEAMLRKKSEQTGTMDRMLRGWDTWRDAYQFNCGDYDRERADGLLAAWDGKSTNKPPALYLEKPYLLARVGGTVKLAAPILTNSGTVHLHLIPEGKQFGRWTNQLASEHLECELPWTSSEQNDFLDEISYSFSAVTPGKYFLKAVWDKRAPTNDVMAAGPGDYESKLIAVVLKAGDVVTNLAVACTNRVKGGEGYYSADAAAVRSWKVTGELTPGMFSGAPTLGRIAIPPQNRVELFSRGAQRWILATNHAPATNEPKLLRVALGYAEVWSRRRPLWRSKSEYVPALKLYFDDRAERGHVNETELVIEDEHGCVFRHGYEAWPLRSSVNFPRYPKSSKMFRLINRKDRMIAWDFTLTNLVATNVVYAKGERLPVSKDLGPATLKISGLRIGGQLLGADAEFFTKSGDRASGWNLMDKTLVDEAGIDVLQFGMCREETSVVLRATAVRDAESAPETFSVSVPKLPAAGEFVAMDLSTNLSGAKLTVLGVVGGGNVRFELADFRADGSSSVSGGDFEVERRGNKVRVKTKDVRLVLRAHAREDDAVIYLRGAEGWSGEGLGDDFYLDERTRLSFIPLDKHLSNGRAEVTFAADKKIPVEFTIEPPNDLKAADRGWRRRL